MPDADYSKYEEALARAIRFERRHEPHNALEWCIVALRFQPDDPVAIRHKIRAEQEIERQSSGQNPIPVQLSLAQQETLDRYLLLAESFIANRAISQAARQLKKASALSPGHPEVVRLCQIAKIELADMPDNDEYAESPEENGYEDAAPKGKEDKTLLIRRLAVAKALQKSGSFEGARNVLHGLLDTFGPLPEITALLKE